MRRLTEISAYPRSIGWKRKRKAERKDGAAERRNAKAVKNSLSNTGLEDAQALNSLMYRFEGSEGQAENRYFGSNEEGTMGRQVREETSSYLENLILKNAKRNERSNRNKRPERHPVKPFGSPEILSLW